MSRKTYSAQFKKDAVAAYESSEASMAQVASDLGINRNSLQNWVNQFGTGVRARRRKEVDAARVLSEAERIRRLEKENALLKEERDILRKAAQYFAKEMSL